LAYEVRSKIGSSLGGFGFRSQLTASARRHRLGIAIFILCGYLHVPLSFRQRVTSTLRGRSERNEYFVVVVVINLPKSAIHNPSPNHCDSIECFPIQILGGIPSSRDHCPRRACSHRGCGHPSWASSAWASCCRRLIRSHLTQHFWGGRHHSSLQYALT
jgi:hypothetical protein